MYTTANGTQIIVLPKSGTLDEMWDALGFLWEEARPHPRVEGCFYAPGRHPEGVYRRLAAGLGSIARRGTGESEFALGRPRHGLRAFAWESPAGRWTRRHWRVTGRLRLVGGRLVADQIVVAVESTARREEEAVSEWTVFTDGPLDHLMSERLNWVVAQFAARRIQTAGCPEEVEWQYTYGRKADGWAAPDGWKPVSLTGEEVEAYHDLHTSPQAAWVTPAGRILLEDDGDGSARLHGPDTAVQELISLFWANAPKTEINRSAPASGPIPQPADAEELRELLWWAYSEAGDANSRFYEWPGATERPVYELLAVLPEGDPATLWPELKKLRPELANYVLGRSSR